MSVEETKKVEKSHPDDLASLQTEVRQGLFSVAHLSVRLLRILISDAIVVGFIKAYAYINNIYLPLWFDTATAIGGLVVIGYISIVGYVSDISESTPAWLKHFASTRFKVQLTSRNLPGEDTSDKELLE